MHAGTIVGQDRALTLTKKCTCKGMVDQGIRLGGPGDQAKLTSTW